MPTVYHWKRFWLPRGETVNLSDGGFLYDPESKYGRELNPNLVTYQDLSEIPSLALLGEPGIGKSRTLQAEVDGAKNSISAVGDTILWLDLRSFGSEDRLWKSLFQSEEFERWRAGDKFLHLFLDSLDECLLRIDNVAALLADQLPKEPVNRLRIRIACRTAPWPRLLETALIELYGEEKFAACELAPLRRRDVELALDQRGILEAEDFFARVEALDVSSLAIKPITLGFLVDTFLRDGDLPAGQIELYSRGCRILCEESSDNRARRKDLLSVDRRIQIASRIAAVTQFCNRFAVWTGSEADIPPQEDVPASDISGTDDDLTVTIDMIREVLDTGLFSSRGQGRIGWAHQTYAEFLAASYCLQRKMPLSQINSLLFHPEGGGQRLVPQLYDIAAWLSVLDPRVLEDVVRGDPESLLGAAGASLQETERELVVQSLLDQSDRGRLLNLRWGLFRLYRKLNHAKLADQLRPYMRDHLLKDQARHVAVDIAHACKVEQLGPELVDIAFDTTEHMSLRLAAGKAAADIGTQDVRARLRPFAFGLAGDDPEDELKGIGLTALWPTSITADELFPLLTFPKERNFHGAYSSFLYGLGRSLQAHHLPTALRWFSEQKHRDVGQIGTLMDEIIFLSLQHLEYPGVLRELATALLSRVKLHDHLLGDQTALDIDDRHRQALVGELIPRLGESDLFFLEYSGFRFVPKLDIPWLIRRIETHESPSTEQLEASMVRRLVDRSDPEQMRTLWLACQTNTILSTVCEQVFSVPLDSEEVIMYRENLRNRQRVETVLDPPPNVRILRDLVEIEQGNLLAWVRLTRDLSLKPTSTQWEDPDNPDLTALPGWASSEDATRKRVMEAALRYVKEGDPENEKWFNTSSIYFSAIAGFQGLGLLLIVDPQKLESLTPEIWKKWVPIILKYPHGETRNPSLRIVLLQMALKQTPDHVAKSLLQIVDSDNDTNGYLLANHEIELCWSKELGAELLSKAKSPNTKPPVVKALLGLVIQHDIPGALNLARSFIVVPPPPEPRRELMIGAMEALISAARDAGWADIWPVLRDYPEFGRALVGSISYANPGAAKFLDNLDENQVADFYVWLLKNYPPSEFDHRVSGAVGPSQTAVMLRDQTLQHLKNRRTFAACNAIRRVMEAAPQYAWLALHLEEAEAFARASTWRPLSPRDLLQLSSNSAKRLVETEGQLIDVIVESLDRLQMRMHDELPAAMHLWSVLPTGKLRPKYEEDLSDYVALYLREDLRDRGIVLNREVQIRPHPKQRTDIHVDAVVPAARGSRFDVVRAIIEVKGDWNRELDFAMKTQLRDDYLRENGSHYGLYLVGWFSCEQWDQGDYRKSDCPAMTLEEAREHFLKQALALSTDGYHLRSYVLDIRVR